MALSALVQTETFNNMVTTTLKNIEPMLVPQIYALSSLLNHFKTTGKIKMLDGGLQIGVGVVGEENPNFEWYNGSTVAADDESEQFTRALYDWALARIAVKISDEDIDLNSGKSQINNLLLELIENAKRTVAAEIDQALHGTRTAANQLLGIGNFVTEATGVSVGGLSPTTNTYWDNVRITSGVDFWASAALPGNLVSAGLLPAYMDMVEFVPATERDIIIITTPDIFAGYESSLEGIAQLQLTDARKGKLGFGLDEDALTYKGHPFIYSNNAEAEAVRMINTRYLWLAVHSKRNFAWDPARTYPNAHATVSYCRFMGQLVTNMRRAHAGIFNVVADT
jgi:hypothetical protein